MTHGRPVNKAMISPNPDNLTSSPAQASTVNRIDLTNPATLYDIELVRRFKASDGKAFGEIVARHRGRVFSIALNHLRNHADAEEITQDAFVRAYQSLPLFRGECSLASWLYRIVFNLSRNRCGYFSRRHRGDTYSFDAAISENNGATFKDLIAGDQPDPAREETNREFLALVKVCCPIVCPAVRVFNCVCKLVLYEVRPHLKNFIKNCSCCCPETMWCHFFLAIPCQRALNFDPP